MNELLQYVSERQWRRSVVARLGNIPTPLSVASFGAIAGAAQTTNKAAFAAWLAELNADPTVAGYIPPAADAYDIADQVLWDFAGRTEGIQIFGGGQFASRLNIVTGSSPAFKLFRSGGTGPTDQQNLYYSYFHDFSIYTDINGDGLRFGENDWSSGIGSTVFMNMNMVNSNSSNSNTAVAVRENQMFSCTSINVVRVAKPHYGIAHKLVGPTFCNYIGCSTGNSQKAIYITDAEGDPYQGFVSENIWASVDLENYTDGVTCDSPNAAKNLFHTGRFFSYYNDGYDVVGMDGVAGSGNVLTFDNPNFTGGNGLSPTNYRGVLIRGYRQPNFIRAMPATTVAVTNTYAQPMSVFVFGGTVTGITINGFGPMAFTGGSFMVQPEDTVALTYTGSPAWLWCPVVN